MKSAALALLLFAFVVRADAACPPPVTPTQPANRIITSETHINFAWTPAGTAVTGYDLFVAKDGGPPTIACRNSPSPDCSVTLGTGKYEWFVRNFTLDCLNGSESAHATFEVVACSAPVAPNALDSHVTGTIATLQWAGGSADKYDVFLDSGSSCTSSTPFTSTPGNSATTASLTRGATYAWRVRASRGSTCPAPVVSSCATFTIPLCDPPAAPSLQVPAAGASNVAPLATLTWNAAAGATSYDVFTRSNPAANFAFAGSTTSTSINAQFAPGSNIEWFVDAVNGTCRMSSARQTFAVAGCSLAAPIAIAPAGSTATGAPIVFRWTAVANAERYRVWLAKRGDAFAAVEETSDLTFTAHRPHGAYDWFVEAIGASCPSARSATVQFSVPTPDTCPTNAPALLTPSNGATTTGPVAFTWSAAPGATRYELWTALRNTAPTRVGVTTATALTTDLAPGHIRWYVVAHFDGCDDVASAASDLDVTLPAQCASTAAPLLTAPLDDAQQLPTSVDFFWTNVAGASDYRLWVGVDDNPAAIVATTTGVRAQANVPRGRIRWFVEAMFPNCTSRRSAQGSFRTNASAGCTTPAAPSLSAPAGAPSGTSYDLLWSAQPNVDHYEVFESTGTSAPVMFATHDVTMSFRHDAAAPTHYGYRVRAVSNCGAGTGPLSQEAAVLVGPASSPSVVPFGSAAPYVRTYFVPGLGTAVNFTATSDRPWLHINPSSGVLPPEGITLTLTSDLSSLDAGDSTATIRIDTGSSGKLATNATTLNFPVNVSLVTPVVPAPKIASNANALILPAVAHLDGQATFRSDVRLANTAPLPLRYQLTFTPTATDATRSSVQTFVQVAPGATVALNDLLATFFGTNGAASGSLEIHPVTATSDAPPPPASTLVSSRTYAVTPNGTSGQFIPAVPLARFAAQAATLLVPQVSQSGAFRTNVGIVEASSQPAHAVLTFFDAANHPLTQVPLDLLPGEHRQLNGIVTSSNALASAARMEVDVTSPTGLVTAYASILDQQTSDPMLVDAVLVNGSKASRYVVPGLAALDAGGGHRWRSDIRIFNADTAPVATNLTFRQQSGVTQTTTLTLAPGEVRALDDVVRNLFGSDNAGGALAVATDAPSKLSVTARTYFDSGNGTFGQFIPALTETSGTASGERAQQLMQLEQSDRFRSNLGLVELSGQPATVDVTAFVPELKVEPTITLHMAPNEFVQLGSILGQLGLSNVYNARVAVRVTSDTGRVAGYASVIDNTSGDPTFVPSQ